MNVNKTVVFESQAARETDCSLCSSPQAMGRVSLSLSQGGLLTSDSSQQCKPFRSEICVGSSTLTPASPVSQCSSHLIVCASVV